MLAICIIITIVWVVSAARMMLVEAGPEYNKVAVGGLIFLITSPLMALWATVL